jgi:hypothetical protein
MMVLTYWVFAYYWVVFIILSRYKKINKIKFIEIIKKGTHLSKFIIINLPRMKKSNQNHR